MIRWPDQDLPALTATQLKKWQGEINAFPTYSDRVVAAKAQFSVHNTRTNKTFASVKATLKSMCSGARRCAYCEDSAADEVEHFRPKDLYPEAVFVWENYLYACGNCNSPKSNRFAVISRRTGQVLEVTRAKGAPVAPPQAGEPVLIDPRREDPLDFMDLDLLDTFRFVARNDPPHTQARARYTIEVLHLNDRDFLIQARREAFFSYRARLHEYNHKKRAGASDRDLTPLSEAIRLMHHPTVWREMQRQNTLIPDLARLFVEAPEALNW